MTFRLETAPPMVPSLSQNLGITSHLSHVSRHENSQSIQTPISLLPNSEKMTTVSTRVQKLVDYWDNTYMSSSEEDDTVDLLRGDGSLSKTINDLERANSLNNLILRVDDDKYRRRLLQLLGGQLGSGAYLTVRKHVKFLAPKWMFMYDASHDLQRGLGKAGVARSYSGLSKKKRKALKRRLGMGSSSDSAPFSGSGATRNNPARLSDIPLIDQAEMVGGNEKTKARYDNPLGDLNVYLSRLGSTKRRFQAELLCNSRITTLFFYSYGRTPSIARRRCPTRSSVIRAAARVHKLEPELVAAFLLAEQRDQSKNEDRKDFQAAVSILQKNTSIGLGQVTVSTAKGADLFADLLASTTRKRLTHNQIALLLCSDEFNIFAVAKYIRKVADTAHKMSAGNLAKTKTALPDLDVSLFKQHSSKWEAENVVALGSEYTSKPWDGKMYNAWGMFVLNAYQDVVTAGIF